jgi:hypothetical protein
MALTTVMSISLLASLQRAYSSETNRKVLRRRIGGCYCQTARHRPRSWQFSLISPLFFLLTCFVPPFSCHFTHPFQPSRSFWAAERGQGFWEKGTCHLWKRMGRQFPDWEEAQYLQNFRMSKDTFWFLAWTYGRFFARENTRLRSAVLPAKRLTICLHWLAHDPSFAQLATLYALGKSTIVSIVHEGIDILRTQLVPDAIMFPTGWELERVMVDFESLCGLPCYGAAIDWTFVPIEKPEHFGDTYYCYKKFCPTICLASVDARDFYILCECW